MTDRYEYRFHVEVYMKQMDLPAVRDVLIQESVEPTEERIAEYTDQLLAVDTDEMRVDRVTFLGVNNVKLDDDTLLKELDQL